MHQALLRTLQKEKSLEIQKSPEIQKKFASKLFRSLWYFQRRVAKDIKSHERSQSTLNVSNTFKNKWFYDETGLNRIDSSVLRQKAWPSVPATRLWETRERERERRAIWNFQKLWNSSRWTHARACTGDRGIDFNIQRWNWVRGMPPTSGKERKKKAKREETRAKKGSVKGRMMA